MPAAPLSLPPAATIGLPHSLRAPSLAALSGGESVGASASRGLAVCLPRAARYLFQIDMTLYTVWHRASKHFMFAVLL